MAASQSGQISVDLVRRKRKRLAADSGAEPRGHLHLLVYVELVQIELAVDRNQHDSFIVLAAGNYDPCPMVFV